MQFNKGMVFVGCSFTWGGGLEWYTPYNSVKKLNKYFYDVININTAMHKFISKNRYGRKVADAFGTWDVHKGSNGGSDEAALLWLSEIFMLNKTNKIQNPYFQYDHPEFKPDEIEYVIMQFTSPFRNNIVTINGEDIDLKISAVRQMGNHQQKENNVNDFTQTLGSEEFEKFFKFYSENFASWEDLEKYIIKQNLRKIKTTFLKLEEMGIKCRFWTWQNEYVPFVKENKFLNDRYIKFNYDNTEFDSLDDVIKYNPKFRISTSGLLVDDKPVPDDHPTLECHSFIADTIIEYIRKESNV